MLPKAHLTSHSRMSGSRWVITPWWSSGSWRSCLYSSFLLHLLNIFCFCYVHTVSVLYCDHLCMKCSLGISDFIEEISSLFHSTVFLYFFPLITEEGFLMSSLELCIEMGTAFLFSFAFPFSSSSETILPFLHFFFLGMVLFTASCTMSWTSTHHSTGTLIRSNPLNLFVTSTV